jgi:hypothetical protein
MTNFSSETAFKTGLVGILMYVVDMDQLIVVQRNGQGFAIEVSETLTQKLVSKLTKSLEKPSNSLFLDYIENV